LFVEMFKRPLVAIAVAYAIIIIVLRPLIPVPQQTIFPPEKKEIPIISDLSSRFMSVIQKTTPAPYDALLGSIVFGTSVSPLDNDLKEKYKKVGLVHLLVASGTQVSILIGVCLAVVRFLKIPIGIGIISTSFFNILFALMAGCGPSIIRASIMGEITLIGLWLTKESEIYTSLALAAIILMIHDPLVIFDIGFQLTFAATWALVYLAPVLEERIKGWAEPIAPILSVSIAPILATTPITLYNFNQFSLVAVLVNAMVLPWVEVMTVLGFISTALGALFLPVAALLNGFLYFVLIILNEIVYTFSSLPGAFLYLCRPNFVFIICYYILLIKAVESIKANKEILFMKIIKNPIIILLFIAFFFISSLSFGLEKELKVYVIDVGQGDSIFIESPSGKNMLIDGGPKYKRSDAGRKFVLPFLHSKGINKIDILVLTHPHDDHVGGLPSVLADLPVGLVLDSGQPHTSRTYLDFLKIIDSKNIPYKIARAGTVLDLGGGVKGQILSPSEPFIEESALNNNSVVIRLVYGKFSILLSGDVEKEGEDRVQGKRSTLLKAGHHGSRTSSSLEFLERVKPEVALISAGIRNKFHHPHPSTLKRFEELGIKVYRTDLNGIITVKTDGKSYSIETQK